MASEYLIRNVDIARANRAIREIKDMTQDGKTFSITIDVPREKHTSAQQGYYWASLNDYGKHLGMSGRDIQEVLHRAVKCELFGIERYITHGSMRIPVPKGSSKRLTKKEYGELIDTLIIMAGEMGYTIAPPPEEHDDGDTGDRSRQGDERSGGVGPQGEDPAAVNDPAEQGVA